MSTCVTLKPQVGKSFAEAKKVYEKIKSSYASVVESKNKAWHDFIEAPPGEESHEAYREYLWYRTVCKSLGPLLVSARDAYGKTAERMWR